MQETSYRVYVQPDCEMSRSPDGGTERKTNASDYRWIDFSGVKGEYAECHGDEEEAYRSRHEVLHFRICREGMERANYKCK